MKLKAFSHLTFLVLFFASCYDSIDRETTHILKIPIYERSTEAEAEAGLKQGEATALTTFGNIYIYQHYLLINERGKGIHIYDNSNPQAPIQLSFMNIPGNFDMAIRNNILYVDSYDDLLTLDISDINKIQLLKRTDSIFPFSHPTNGVIVGYRDSIVKIEEDIKPAGIFQGRYDDDFNSTERRNFSATNGIAPINNIGTGGSFARFTISNDHLFAIDRNNLNVFDLTNQTNPKHESKTSIDRVQEIETVFPYKDNLYIGSTTGMVIYDISNPKDIRFESVFAHVRACDPVYVEDDIAYVTLRSTNNGPCNGVNNQIDVIDVTEVGSPHLIQSFPMVNPHGVGVDENLLFVCEAEYGLKIIEVQKEIDADKLKKVSLNQLIWNTSIYANDVIPFNGNLIVVGENELNQYDYTNPQNITFLSKIE